MEILEEKTRSNYESIDQVNKKIVEKLLVRHDDDPKDQIPVVAQGVGKGIGLSVHFNIMTKCYF